MGVSLHEIATSMASFVSSISISTSSNDLSSWMRFNSRVPDSIAFRMETFIEAHSTSSICDWTVISLASIPSSSFSLNLFSFRTSNARFFSRSPINSFACASSFFESVSSFDLYFLSLSRATFRLRIALSCQLYKRFGWSAAFRIFA